MVEGLALRQSGFSGKPGIMIPDQFSAATALNHIATVMRYSRVERGTTMSDEAANDRRAADRREGDRRAAEAKYDGGNRRAAHRRDQVNRRAIERRQTERQRPN